MKPLVFAAVILAAAASTPALAENLSSVFAAKKPVVAADWVQFERMNLSVSIPSNFKIKADNDDMFIVTNAEMNAAEGCAVIGQYDNSNDPRDGAPADAVFDTGPDRDLGYGVRFSVNRLQAVDNGIDFDALAVFSRDKLRGEDYLKIVVSCANVGRDVSDALISGVLDSVHLTSDPRGGSDGGASMSAQSGSADAGSAPAQAEGGDALELAFWDTIKDSTDPADFQAYLAQFPNGTFAALARIRVIRLGGDAGQAAADQGASQTQVSPQATGAGLASGENAYDWQLYVNSRFGISIEYPVDMFRPLPPPANNDGRTFETTDGSAGFYVYGQHNALDEDLQTLFASDRNLNSEENVTYSKMGPDWFVVSGLRGNTIFYRKKMLSSDGVIRAFEIYYPRGLKLGFDDIVTRMARSFSATETGIAGGAGGGGAAMSQVPEGVYSSGWGEITFSKGGGSDVAGLYEGGQSRMSGEMNGTTLIGTWHEPNAAVKCSDGNYWGRLVLEFTGDFSSFSGTWGYCNNEPTRPFSGKLKNGGGSPSGSVAQPTPPVSFGPFTTPARGTAERTTLIDAARGPVASDIGQAVIFIVDILRTDGHWAYLQATPVQPSGKPLDWLSTRFASDWQADAMSDTVMVLMSNDGGAWHVVDHVIGPTDVFWYDWIDAYGLPEALFRE